MEANSESMKINLSENTYRLINEEFNCQERESINVKGVGKMKMYYLNPA